MEQIVSDAIINVLTNRKDLLEDALQEALLDIGLARAMDEGLESDVVSEEEVFETLGF